MSKLNELPNLNTLPTHGSLLFVNTANIQGANDLANDLARKILTQDSDRSLALLSAQTHPDFHLVTVEAKSQQIKIDQIRDLLEWVAHKPLIASKKVAIITPAHRLNIAAANALLKTLEEPSEQMLFVLITDKPSFIPATIRSRCFTLRLNINQDHPETMALLTKFEKDLSTFTQPETDLIPLATEWAKQDPKIVCDLFFRVLHRRLSKQTQPGRGIWQLLDSVIKAKQAVLSNSQPNIVLLLESLFIEFQTLTYKKEFKI